MNPPVSTFECRGAVYQNFEFASRIIVEFNGAEERADVASTYPTETERLMSDLSRIMEEEGLEAPSRVLSPKEIKKLRSRSYI
jgi:hypothetical protein